jgi:hypothetical protein
MQTWLALTLALTALGCAHHGRDANLAQRPRTEVPQGDFHRGAAPGPPLQRPSHGPEPITPTPVP